MTLNEAAAIQRKNVTPPPNHKPDPYDRRDGYVVCTRCGRRVIEVWPENAQADGYLRHGGYPPPLRTHAR